tara:strand:- start:60 stop:293 length:234 start_codon:yes stop_codon:yes gene_type:complete
MFLSSPILESMGHPVISPIITKDKTIAFRENREDGETPATKTATLNGMSVKNLISLELTSLNVYKIKNKGNKSERKS